MKSKSNGILLKCGGGQIFRKSNSTELELDYKDGNSGEYECEDSKEDSTKIYVKFRSKFRAVGGFCSIW